MGDRYDWAAFMMRMAKRAVEEMIIRKQTARFHGNLYHALAYNGRGPYAHVHPWSFQVDEKRLSDASSDTRDKS